jgi:putative ABC transport system permease protein
LAVYGDFQAALSIVAGAVLFAAFLATLNAVSMALRERTAELAVLRAIGYGHRRVFALVAAEAALLSGLGGGAGAVGAWALLKVFHPPIPATFGEVLVVHGPVAAVGVGVAVLLGVAAVTVPAVGQLRQPVADLLRRVA